MEKGEDEAAVACARAPVAQTLRTQLLQPLLPLKQMLRVHLSLMVAAAVAAAAAAKPPPHVLFVVGDDVGYSDFGKFNDGKTITPTLDALLDTGIMLTDYYTFKICSPSRAAMTTGRYPWAAGFYDMSQDTDHCTTNSTALPQLLKPLGYKTHALGKWDVGFMQKRCSPTLRG